MKPASPKFFLVVLCAAAVALTGCTKKPTRPDPSATMMGGGTGAAGNSGLVTQDLSNPAPGTGLVEKGDGFGVDNTKRGELESVYFSFDNSDIKQAERVKLEAAKEYLAKNPQYRLILEGHCDWRGTAEYNLSLGDRRAAAVKNYLLKLGVAADKLETLSKGSEESKKGGDEASMSKDRRVEFVVGKATK